MPQNPNSPILIAGAGIAGLAAAIALARAGFRVALIERATRFEEIGAGLQLSPNASRVLREFGLGAAVAREAVAPRALLVRRFRDPRPLARMPMNDAADRFGAPFHATLRADLQTALIDAARADPHISLMVGRSVEDATETESGVRLRVAAARGSEEIEGAALIGADGLWSRTRALIGEAVAPRFTGREAWRALLPAARAPAAAREPFANLWMGPRAHLVHYPVAGGRFVNIVLVREAERPREDTARGGWSAPGDRAELGDLVARMAPPLRDLVAAVDDWLVWSLFDAPPLARWSRGRIALIGDAAHPVLPFLAQGAALAIEDAAILARAAKRTPDDPARAFAAFAARRAPRAARVQHASRSNGRAYHLTGPGAWLRDVVIARLGGEGMLKRHDWLYSWTPDA